MGLWVYILAYFLFLDVLENLNNSMYVPISEQDRKLVKERGHLFEEGCPPQGSTVVSQAGQGSLMFPEARTARV